jgi:hypothetical protein
MLIYVFLTPYYGIDRQTRGFKRDIEKNVTIMYLTHLKYD